MTYENLKSEFRLFDCDGNSWGEVMHWWFVIADEIYFHRDTIEVPGDWQFRPSPLGESNSPDDYAVASVRETPNDELIRFGALIHRYAGALLHAGRDY